MAFGIGEEEYRSAENDELIKLAQSAGPDAAEAEAELVRRYLPLVRSLSRPLYLWGWESEDFLQEGTLGLIKAIRSYDNGRSPYFGVYARACILHELEKALAANTRKKDIPGGELTSLDEADETLEDVTLPDVDEVVIYKDEVERLTGRIVKALSKLERRVLEAYLEGISFDEMTVKLGVTKKTVNNAMYRIRVKSEQIREAEN
ncbi:MAG: sigma-70 family RNA polymerase sigma factor [Clostridia bacterium]|nr:sigma-70 family RNA polymerase sigma factor [Clostridia bacterium]